MTSSNSSVPHAPRRSVFDFPELIEPIAQYLPNHDIVQCMATSKTLARQLEPFLWRHVVLKWSLPAPPALARNRQWIRSLSITASRRYSHGLLDVLSGCGADNLTPAQSSSHDIHHSNRSPETTGDTGFHRLQSILIDIDMSTGYWFENQRLPFVDHALRILQHSPNLTKIILPDCFLGNEYAPVQTQMFLDTLEHKLPHLRQLTLNGTIVDNDTGLRLFSVCFNHPQLTDLRCDFSAVFGQEELSRLLEIVKDSKKEPRIDEEPTMSPIKALVLPLTYDGYTPDFLCTLLKDHLPDIEHFYFHSINNDVAVDLTEAFRDAVAQGCRKLQRLEFMYDYSGSTHIEKAIKGAILGSKEWGLKSIRGAYVGDMDTESNPSMMTALLDHHSSTLEDVELVQSKHVASHVFGRLFHECKNLKRVKIKPVPRPASRVLYYDDMVSKEWACRGLKELHMILAQRPFGSENDGHSCAVDDRDDEERMLELVKKAFGQISRLSKLEILCLGTDNDPPLEQGYKDLSLDHGGLSELAGLKRLRHFGMTEKLWLGIGQAEVEFMDSQWPHLEQISFGHDGISGIASEPHWQWLQTRRPYLKYSQCPLPA
ncbi:hypothetical protein B0O80DRAFT_454980 [Mortierella sp. GBAus27b]|nr:hypothetical protein B0O80DRAFT_454980 [Mortierella sp. GBAus27b]